MVNVLVARRAHLPQPALWPAQVGCVLSVAMARAVTAWHPIAGSYNQEDASMTSRTRHRVPKSVERGQRGAELPLMNSVVNRLAGEHDALCERVLDLAVAAEKSLVEPGNARNLEHALKIWRDLVLRSVSSSLFGGRIHTALGADAPLGTAASCQRTCRRERLVAPHRPPHQRNGQGAGKGPKVGREAGQGYARLCGN